MDILQFEKILDYLESNIEFLSSSQGIFFIICSFVGIIIAVFTYPKHYVRNFYIYAACIFISTTFFWYIGNWCGSFKFVNLPYYVQDYLGFWYLGVGYTFVFGILYWIAVGAIAIGGRKKDVSFVKRIILFIVICFVVFLLAMLCDSNALILAFKIGQMCWDIKMTK